MLLDEVDDDGFLVVPVAAIDDRYRELVDRCTDAVVASVPSLAAVLLYGSVARGRATPPHSDLDLLAVVADPAARPHVQRLAVQLTARHAAEVHDVGVTVVTRAELLADDLDGMGNRAFLKHSCVPVWGADIGATLAPARPTPQLAWAYNHSVGRSVDACRSDLAISCTPTEVAVVARRAARRTLLACASLASVRTGRWTTDREVAVAFVDERHPSWADDAHAAMQWCHEPTYDRVEAAVFLDGFAAWVVAELADACGEPPERA